jgi:hypothetical protein
MKILKFITIFYEFSTELRFNQQPKHPVDARLRWFTAEPNRDLGIGSTFFKS